MIYIIEILIIAINVTMAWHHSNLIADEKKIYHGWWGLAYFVFVCFAAWLGKSWVLLALSFPLRKVVFDLSLNLFRGLPLFYVSTKTTSLIDQLHNYIFGKKSEYYMFFYVVIIVILNAFL